MGSFEVNWQ